MEICKEKLACTINGHEEQFGRDSVYFERSEFEKFELSNFFTVEKTLELLVVSGLFVEAVYFVDAINDWKSAFMLASVLKVSGKFSELESKAEELLVSKIYPILSHGKNSEMLVKEVILCSVLTKNNVIEPLLNSLMIDLVKLVLKLPALVPHEFYLPAPPIFCPQMQEDRDNQEASLRSQLSSLVTAIIGNFFLNLIIF